MTTVNHQRWNIEQGSDGELHICDGSHETHEGCEYTIYVPNERVFERVDRARREALEDAAALLDEAAAAAGEENDIKRKAAYEFHASAIRNL